jgi:hypothetical protein
MNTLRSGVRRAVIAILCVFEIASANAAGLYDGAWTGQALPTLGRCRNPLGVKVTITNNTLSGVWDDRPMQGVTSTLATHGQVVGVVKEDGTLDGGVRSEHGTAKLSGKFAGSSFKGSFHGQTCTFEMTLERAH